MYVVFPIDLVVAAVVFTVTGIGKIHSNAVELFRITENTYF